MDSMAMPPAAVRRCAIWSVSMMAAPRAANMSVTRVLPLPMPPVRPTEKMASKTELMVSGHSAQIGLHDGIAVQQSDQAGCRQVRTERNRIVATVFGQRDQRNSERCADHR